MAATVISGRNADVYLTSAGSVGAVGVTLECRGGTGSIYSVHNALDEGYAFWDEAEGCTVYDGGSVLTPGTDYTVAYGGGEVYLKAVPAGTVKADMYTFSCAKIVNGKEWSLDVKGNLIPGDIFGTTWREFAPGARSASATVSRWNVQADADVFLNALTAATKFGLFLQTDYGTTPTDWSEGFICYAYTTGDSLKVAAEAIVEESLDFTVSGPVTQLFHVN